MYNVCTCTMYMYNVHIHTCMHGPLAKLVVEEKKEETQMQYTIPEQYKHVCYICGHLHMYIVIHVHVCIHKFTCTCIYQTLTVVSVVRGVYPVIK